MKASEMQTGEKKALVSTEPMKQPSWLVWSLMKLIRLVMLTTLWSGLGMGAGLFCGIVGILAWSVVTHRAPDMSLAYRHVSIPVAICSGSGAFLWNLGRTFQAAAKRRKGEQ